MKSEIFWFVLGVISTLIINLISPPIYSNLRMRILRIIRLIKTRKPVTLILGPSLPKQKMKIGGLELDFFVLQYANFKPSLIQTTYTDNCKPLTKEFDTLKKKFIDDINRRKKQGEFGLPYNGSTYKLMKFEVGNREIIDGEELPILQLGFGPTDYFTQLITDLNVKNPTRNKIASKYNLLETPVSEFASILGVNFNLLTKDGYLIITRRSSNVNINRGIYHTSVAENLLRPTDGDVNGAPNLFNCARRGIQEEIGISVDIADIEFTTFGVYPPWCQYKIIGWSEIKETKKEVEFIHSIAVAKDKWENTELIFVPCNPKSIAEFINQTIDDWYDIGLACVVFSLFQVGHSIKDIQTAFIKTKKGNNINSSSNNV